MDFLADFGVQPLLLAAQVVNFLILLFILKKFLYQPILKVLQLRREKIEKSLKQVEEIERRTLEMTDRETESKLRAAREGERIINEAGEFAARLIEDGRREYENFIKRGTEDARKLAQFEKTKLMQDAKENIGDILILALQKVTGKMINKKDQKQFIEKAVKEIRS